MIFSGLKAINKFVLLTVVTGIILILLFCKRNSALDFFTRITGIFENGSLSRLPVSIKANNVAVFPLFSIIKVNNSFFDKVRLYSLKTMLDAIYATTAQTIIVEDETSKYNTELFIEINGRLNTMVASITTPKQITLENKNIIIDLIYEKIFTYLKATNIITKQDKIFDKNKITLGNSSTKIIIEYSPPIREAITNLISDFDDFENKAVISSKTKVTKKFKQNKISM